MDEADFYRKGSKIDTGDIDKANKIYHEVTDRRTSRFLVKGYDPGISILISSASHNTSFTAKRVRAVTQNGSGCSI